MCLWYIPEGRRELFSFRQAPAEIEALCEAFLEDLYRRGLQGKALDIVQPYLPRQRCWVHKLRDVAARLPKKLHKARLEEAKTISTKPRTGERP